MPKIDQIDPNPALQGLELLIGKWEMKLSNADFLPDRSASITGSVSFEWLEQKAFVIMRMGGKPSGAPGAIWLMHRDESSPDYTAFYYDDRKVSRIYQMSFSQRSWKLWRESPGFSQRFEGSISTNQKVITASWEKSTDGQHWTHDFDVVYTRLK